MRCYHAVGLQIIDRPPPSEQEFMTARTVMFILRLMSWGFFLRLFIVRYVIRACNTAVNVMTHWGSHFDVSCQERRRETKRRLHTVHPDCPFKIASRAEVVSKRPFRMTGQTRQNAFTVHLESERTR